MMEVNCMSRASSSVDNIPPQSRRLDSIAWLIQGDDICGSACFDGERLLLATNKPVQSRLVDSVLDYLTYIAKKGAELQRYPEREKEVMSKIDRERDRVRVEMSDTELGRTNNQYKEDFIRSLDKTTNSILSSYIEPTSSKALPMEMAKTIEKGNYRFISSQKGVHAEMKVVEKLLVRNKLDNGQEQYVGISKRCCANCEAMIQAINEVKAKEQQGGVIKEVIKVREEGHSLHFKSAIPEFVVEGNKILRANESKAIREKFLEKVGVSSLEEAYHESKPQVGIRRPQTNTKSVSPPDRFAVLDKQNNKQSDQNLSSSSSSVNSSSKQEAVPRSSNISNESTIASTQNVSSSSSSPSTLQQRLSSRMPSTTSQQKRSFASRIEQERLTRGDVSTSVSSNAVSLEGDSNKRAKSGGTSSDSNSNLQMGGIANVTSVPNTTNLVPANTPNVRKSSDKGQIKR